MRVQIGKGSFGASAVAMLVSGCLDHPLKPVEVSPNSNIVSTVALALNRDVDILFVIDNSGSMAEEQAVLAANFEAFVDVLEHEDVRANYRIGVTTTDNGNTICGGTTPEGGKLRATSCRTRTSEFTFVGGPGGPTDRSQEACLELCPDRPLDLLPTSTTADAVEIPRPWIEVGAKGTNLPDGWTSTEAFQCIGPQGINGCGFESPLESMYKSLAGTSVETTERFGFIRDHALLGVVFVTDEADCSHRNAGSVDADIFDPDGQRALWSDPDLSYPTSAVCWNAGVDCVDDGNGFLDCTATHHDASGQGGVDADDAVLHPLERYVDLLERIEEDKRAFNPGAEVLVGVIAGVGSDGSPTYQNTGDAAFIRDYGVAPGCTSVAGTAVPPVRLLEFADRMSVNDEQNVFSVCEDDYSPALEAIANALAEEFVPPCFQACAGDTAPEEEGLQPTCAVNVEFEGSTWPMPHCDQAEGDEVCYTLKTGSALSEECRADGWNLEFEVRGELDPGSTAKASCVVSGNPAVDCPAHM